MLTEKSTSCADASTQFLSLFRDAIYGCGEASGFVGIALEMHADAACDARGEGGAGCIRVVYNAGKLTVDNGEVMNLGRIPSGIGRCQCEGKGDGVSAWKGVIFDLDGTLVDSQLDFDLMRSEMGLPPRKPILEALADLEPGTALDQCLVILRRHEIAGAERAMLMPGAAEFLDHLIDRRIPMGVLTRNSRESTDLVLARLQLELWPVVTREDAPPKPDPGGLLQICERWKVDPSEVLFFGDYLFDLHAGRNAGMATVLYAPEELPEYAREADFVIRHFVEAAALLETAVRPPRGDRR